MKMRDKEGRPRNRAGQLIIAEGSVIPDVINVSGTNDFDLNHEWYDWGSEDLPLEDPKDLIKELEEIASASDIQTLTDQMSNHNPGQLVGLPHQRHQGFPA